ncbi:hypothetical protein OPT61_g8414 [Boeremia exigua]|uniref:Uncharacterized protein n=1 Tax=Boeremia exigua TaxID=749465 RepID=A0ACC2HYX1_9PLEO|nr:hypothetical protein OPT61_g8414 [Boeremia exigua]
MQAAIAKSARESNAGEESSRSGAPTPAKTTRRPQTKRRRQSEVVARQGCTSTGFRDRFSNGQAERWP